MGKKQENKAENMKWLGGDRYIVWTQAGFKKAIRHLLEFGDKTDEVEGYPDQYPCVVDFFRQYRSYSYWVAVCIPLSASIENARARLEKLISADEEHKKAME